MIKDYLKSKFITNRTIGFFIGAACAVLSVLLSIVFYILVFKDRVRTGHEGLNVTMIFILMLLGGLSYLLVALINYKHVAPYLPIIPVILCGTGLAIHINLTTYPLADKFTGIEFFGGNPNVFLIFAIMFAICTIGLVAASFMNQKKYPC